MAPYLLYVLHLTDIVYKINIIFSNILFSRMVLIIEMVFFLTCMCCIYTSIPFSIRYVFIFNTGTCINTFFKLEDAEEYKRMQRKGPTPNAGENQHGNSGHCQHANRRGKAVPESTREHNAQPDANVEKIDEKCENNTLKKTMEMYTLK